MYEELLQTLMIRPPAYAPSTHPFWGDPHIARHVLDASLPPPHTPKEADAAEDTARWIHSLHGGELLDLGCGPGLMAERFCRAGFTVTGMDFCQEAIARGRASAKEKGLAIRYHAGNYLSLGDENAYDVITLLSCDLGSICQSSRRRLLPKIHRALRPGGLFIADGLSPPCYDRFEEGSAFYSTRSGFFTPAPYACIKERLRYAPAVMLTAYHVITAEDLRSYYQWNQAFTEDCLQKELHEAGFSSVTMVGDTCGSPFRADGDSLCAVAAKE